MPYLIKTVSAYLSAVKIIILSAHSILADTPVITSRADNAQTVIENDIQFPRQAIRELEDMDKLVKEIYETAIKSARENNTSLVPKVRELEAQIDIKEKEMRDAHIKRMMTGEIDADSGTIFLEILSNFERIGDHAVNISHLPQGKI